MTAEASQQIAAAEGSKRPGTIGVVIPGYGHPQFLSEAVISACTQDIEQPVQVVVVDDGCRYPETGKIVANLMEQFPGTLYYLRQENTRLPGARNSGVRFLMSFIEDLDAVFFLDADNRLSPYSLRNYREILGDDPAVGWAYPDISFIGMTWGEEGFDTRETAPEYSRLKHLLGNISEAGSLVRADLFRNDVFFDETMRYGFEDWDFWLSALEAGYVGRRVRHAGFLYRRRPESMLADSRRQEDELISKMHRKHAPLFRPRHLMRLEQEEAPYFALLFADSGRVLLTSDPLEEGQMVSLDEFKARGRRWQYDRREFFFPDSIVVLTEAQWQQLNEQRHFLRWLFWAMKEQEDLFQRWLFESRPRPFYEGLPEDTPIVANSILHVKAGGVYDLARQVADGGKVSLPDFAPYVFQAPLPLTSIKEKGLQDLLCQQVSDLVADIGSAPPRVRHAERRFAGPSAIRCRTDLVADICAEEGRQPFPAANSCRRTLVAVDQATLESVSRRSQLVSLLQGLKDERCEIVMVLERVNALDFDLVGYEEWRSLVADFVVLDRVHSSLEYRMYLGRRIFSLFTLKSKEDGAIIARSVDQIITIGATAFLEVLGDARQHGVKGYVYFTKDFADGDPFISDDMAKVLAFEHAEERVVCDNADMIEALAAQGFPPGKFVSEAGLLEILGSR